MLEYTMNKVINAREKIHIIIMYHNLESETMKFEFSKITRSRLMGSMGLHIKWKKEDKYFHQFFLLDSEGDGIADYVGLYDPLEEEVFQEEARLTGGLGSPFSRLTKKETLNLLYEYAKANINKGISLPEPFEDYKDFLIKDVKVDSKKLFMKLCISLSSEVEFINYMAMRLIANDIQALKYFSNDIEAFPIVAKQGATLLKNTVSHVSGHRYSCVAIFEDHTGFYSQTLGFTLKEEENYILRAVLKGKNHKLSREEIANEMKRTEFIATFKNNNSNSKEKLISILPTLYKVPFEKGDLYTKFRPNNSHVKKSEYIISDDLEGIYFISKKEIVFSALDEQSYKNGLKILSHIESLLLNSEFIFPSPVIYDFAEAKESTFAQFLANI